MMTQLRRSWVIISAWGVLVDKIHCACGCGLMIDSKDSQGRVKTCRQGHSPHHPWQGGRYKTTQGYVMVFAGKGHHLAGPNGYAAEHRVVAEQILGRPLASKEVVHHKNGDRADNRPENLSVYDGSGEHCRDHQRSLSEDEVSELKAEYALGRLSSSELAVMYDVSPRAVRRILLGGTCGSVSESTPSRTWKRHYGPIPHGFSVWHRNGDRWGNRIENLELIDALTRGRLVSGCIQDEMGGWWKPCRSCGRILPVSSHYYRRATGHIQSECKLCSGRRAERNRQLRLARKRAA